MNFSVAAAVLLSAVVAWAGITGSISGTVTDPSGAVMADVTVTVTSMSTNVQSTTVTDAKGFYSFPALNVDHYDVTVNQSGFKNFLERGVRINANSAILIDIKLEVGQVTNTITVQSDTLQVETQSTQMGEVIEGSTITSVPLNGRSYIDLLALQPGVSPYAGNDTAAGLVQAPISGSLNNGTQSINGGRPEANGFMVNGADAEEGVHNGAAIVPNLDSIAEFRIITNNFNAEYGNYSGGQINVVTKSGSNQFHGDLFDFLRNTDLDARNYFSPTRGVFIQNQFGGIFGGPIRKNRLFFFVDYQGTRQIVGATQYYPVPSVADRSGNLSDLASSFSSGTDADNNPIATTITAANWATILGSRLGYTVTNGEPYSYTAGMVNPATIGASGIGVPYSSNCTSNNPVTGCVFPNAVIPQTAWDPVAVNMLKYIPSPNGNGPL
ncbi:MAG: carboxypeptidase-like regulatory domain-containing protein, partial [Candidatus Sulfotelmatobacter sp.]